jgi:hypothetical protein
MLALQGKIGFIGIVIDTTSTPSPGEMLSTQAFNRVTSLAIVLNRNKLIRVRTNFSGQRGSGKTMDEPVVLHPMTGRDPG